MCDEDGGGFGGHLAKGGSVMIEHIRYIFPGLDIYCTSDPAQQITTADRYRSGETACKRNNYRLLESTVSFILVVQKAL